jgi:uncharacterized protein
MKRLLMMFFVAGLLAQTQAQAQASAMGEIRVAVADRSVEARQQALREGLGEVLVRLTGDPAVSSSAAVAPLLRDPSRWAQQFGYEAGVTPDLLMLTARFDIPILMRELERASVPVWTLTRPGTLFWVVVQRGGAGEILSQGSTDPAVASMLGRAQARGLPVILPVMDAQDVAVIQPADIRGQFDQVIARASARYPSVFSVTAVLYPGSAPQLRWRLMHMGRIEESGQIDAMDEAEAMRLLVDRVTGLIAPRYVVTPGDTRAQRLVIQGVASLDDWRQVTTHIQGLAGVAQLHVANLSGRQLELALQFSGQPSQLPALLGLNPRLAPCPSTFGPLTPPAPAEDGELPVFCWQAASSQ